MSHFGGVVATDYIDAVAFCAYPFAVAAINSHGSHTDSLQQIVAITAAIIARNDNLRISVVGRLLLLWSEHQRSLIGACPYIAIFIFSHTVEAIDVAQGCFVLIAQGIETVHLVCFRVDAHQARVMVMTVDKPNLTRMVGRRVAQDG